MNSTKVLKLLIWSYFWLLLFEGALRKWVLPGLASPLLLVRDPIVIIALTLAVIAGKMKMNLYLVLTALVAIVAPIFTMLDGHGNMVVTLFGWRANFLHFPFIFLIAQVFSTEDVKSMGKWFMLCSIPMIFLMAAQFYSPAGSWINIGVGGEGDSGFDGAMGYRRPPGTFSFTNGLSVFFPVVAAFALAEITRIKKTRRFLAIAACIAILAAMPISISRSLVLGVAVVGVGAIIAMTRGKRSFKRLITMAMMLSVALTAANFLPGMEKPREAFLSRWDASTTQLGGFQEAILERALHDLTAGLLSDIEKPLTGAGLGMGTNAGAQILAGERTFLISEAEWGRLTGEMGLPLGILFIIVRVTLTIVMLVGAWRLSKKGESLALLLWFATAMNFMQGQWGQPTALGFATLGAGMALAVIRSSQLSNKVEGIDANVPNDPLSLSQANG